MTLRALSGRRAAWRAAMSQLDTRAASWEIIGSSPFPSCASTIAVPPVVVSVKLQCAHGASASVMMLSTGSRVPVDR